MTETTNAPEREPATGRERQGPRCIALVGPFQTGKTTLLEAIAARTGALQRQGSVVAGTSIGDASGEARAHHISVELNVATVDFMGEAYTFIDCPGSVEFLHEMQAVLPAVDAAIVVCDFDDKKVATLQLILRSLEERAIPRLMFLNKLDASDRDLAEVTAALQRASRVPLLLRQMPIRQGGAAVGFIDLALERAFLYQGQAPSRVVSIPADATDEEKQARYAMLEQLSEHDEQLIEDLIEEVEPERARVFEDLAHEVRDGLAVPVLIGSAQNGNGVSRLMKALRHEVPGVASAAQRLGIASAGEALAQVVKTLHTTHGGKLSLVRVLRGAFKEGMTVATSSGQTARISGIFRLMGNTTQKLAAARGGRHGRARPRRSGPHGRYPVGRRKPAGAARRSGARPARHGARGPRPRAEGRGEARRRSPQAGRRGSFSGGRARPGERRIDPARPGRDAPARRDRAARVQIRRSPWTPAGRRSGIAKPFARR